MNVSNYDLAPHEFGQPIPQTPSSDVVKFLWNRRSASAPLLVAPGPSADEMDLLIRLGLRVPDHGKIGPWRVVRFMPESKALLVEKLRGLAGRQDDAKKAEAALMKLAIPPEALLIVSSPVQPHKIPLWEQQLSAAAVCQNLLIAAGAMGYGANWITDWYSYDSEAKTLLGLASHENVAGFIYLGTLAEPSPERERPNIDSRVGWWDGD